MSRLWWMCAMSLCISTPLVAQQSNVLTRYEAGLDLLAAAQTPVGAAVFSDETAPAKKSVALAALYSLLLPGMGELYAEGFSTGKYLLIAEGVLWLGFAAVEIHGNDLRDGARTYAAAHAGLDATGKDDDFYVNIGNFMSLEEYNDKQLRDREPEKLYDPLEGYNWLWDSDASRLAFRDQRISSENMYNNQKFIGAAIIVNHIISAINAARSAIAYNNAQDDALGALQFSSRILGSTRQPHGVMVTIARQF